MIEWNTRFEFIDLNRASENMFGFKRADVVGQPASNNILFEKDVTEANGIWAALMAGSGGWRHQNKNRTKDGRTILCEWYNTPLVNELGEVIGVTSLIMDVTEQKRLASIERNTKKQLKQLMDGMLTMIATLLPDGTVSFIKIERASCRERV